MYPQKSAKYESLDSISRLKSNRLPEENHPNKNYISDWYKNTDILREKFMERLQIGDLLEFERGRYKHWAVYVGPGKIHDHEVVHLRNWGRTSRWFSKGSASRQSQNAIGKLVQCNSLFDAWSECACRINNSFDEKAQPFAWHEVRERAIRCTVASRKEFEKYRLLTMNCEHFVHWVRYNYAESLQVQDYIDSFMSVAKACISSVEYQKDIPL